MNKFLLLLKAKEKSSIKDILYNSLAQAFIRVFLTSHLTVKTFLIFVIISTSSLASYFIIESILSYLNYEVVTTSRIIYETPALFPKITICNRNRFQTRFALDFLKQVNREIRKDVDFFVREEISTIKYKEKKKLMDDINEIASGKIRNGFNDTQKKRLGHDIRDILISCKFDGIECNADDFTWNFDPYYGNCFEFNSGKFSRKLQIPC
jgi:hypothetical protein